MEKLYGRERHFVSLVNITSGYFRTGLDNISLHFKNISNKAKLDDNLTTEDFSVVYQDMHILKKDK